MSTIHTMQDKRANFISKMVVVPITVVLPDGIARRTMWKCEVYSSLFDAPIHTTQNSLSEHSAVLRASYWINKEGYTWAYPS
jgi:hypothetical protein